MPSSDRVFLSTNGTLQRGGDAPLKRLILLMLLLAVALSAAACGPVSGTGDASPPPEDSQAVPAVPETAAQIRLGQ